MKAPTHLVQLSIWKVGSGTLAMDIQKSSLKIKYIKELMNETILVVFSFCFLFTIDVKCSK